MKKHIVGILLMLGLVAMVTGCGWMHRYDARLVQADSLMQPAPDSALAIVSVLDSLAGDANLAYRDLLLTQARYKCYAEITAGDDSAVTCAMAWYRAHDGEREKLTRAYLYKGAVMQELGHVDSAMYYSKTAEVTADSKDYANLGQINTRIARLYRDYYADPQICYDKYKRALKYYNLTGNKPQQLICLVNMGGCSDIFRIGNPEKLLSEASQLAVELDDSAKCYQIQELLCRQMAYYGDSITKAKQIAFQCLKDYRQFINVNLMLDLAEIYVKSEMPDSAKYYLAYVDESASVSNSEQIKTRKYSILSRIARLEGNMTQSNHYDMLAHQVTDSILNSEQRYQIQQIENKFNNHQQNSFLSKISHLQWMVIVLSLLALIVIIMLTIAYLRRLQRTRVIIKELQNINPTYPAQMLNKFDAKDESIKHVVSNLVSILKMCIDENSRPTSTTQLARQIKETIIDVADDNFWTALRTYLDKDYNNVVSVIANNPNITLKDLKLIELMCCGFSYLEIALILDYAPKYVLNKRRNIAKKLELEVPLMEYLKGLMTLRGPKEYYRK